jgi:hypothetical protein
MRHRPALRTLKRVQLIVQLQVDVDDHMIAIAACTLHDHREEVPLVHSIT